MLKKTIMTVAIAAALPAAAQAQTGAHGVADSTVTAIAKDTVSDIARICGNRDAGRPVVFTRFYVGIMRDVRRPFAVSANGRDTVRIDPVDERHRHRTRDSGAVHGQPAQAVERPTGQMNELAMDHVRLDGCRDGEGVPVIFLIPRLRFARYGRLISASNQDTERRSTTPPLSVDQVHGARLTHATDRVVLPFGTDYAQTVLTP